MFPSGSPRAAVRSRRHPLRLRPVLLLAAAGLTWGVAPGRAAVQTWSGGDGTWGTAGAWSGGSWVAGNTALFGGTAGMVTVGTQTAGGLIFNVGGYTLQSGTLTLNTGAVIATNNGGTTTFAGTLNLAGAAGVALTKTGSGTLALSTNNSGLGTTASPSQWTVTGGTFNTTTRTFDSTLAIAFGSCLGATPTAAATQLILDAGTLQITTAGSPAIGANRTFQINAAGGAIADTSGGSNSYLNAIVDNAGAGSSLYLSNTGGTATFSGAISGTGGVTWSGTGTGLLSGTNTYSGGTRINAGTLQFVTDANLGAAGGAVTLAGGTLASAQTATVTMTRTIATGTVGGTIQLNNGVPSNNANKITLGTAGQLTGSGPITVTNNGLLSVSAANAGFSGAWTLNGGVLELTTGTAAGTGGITVNTGAELTTLGSQITNALTLNGGRIGWDFYSGSGDYQGAVNLQGGGGVVSLVNFYGAGAISGTISGNITGAGGLSTSATGPSATTAGGVLTLTGNNNYTGGTAVGTGTTVVVGSNTALGAASNALAVTGTLTLNGFSPTVGALSLTGGATINYNLGAGTVEKLTAASATITGANDLAFNPANLSGTGTYNVLTSTNGTLNGTPEFSGAENLTVPANTIIVKNSAGNYYSLTLGNSGGSETLTVSSNVPNKVLTFLPFGSSITAGTSAQTPYNGGGYRSQLYQDIVNDGRFVPNFVGSSNAITATNPNEGNILSSAGQTAHEGHPGWTTLQMLANLGTRADGNPAANGGHWLQVGNGENPNYITVNIGGNDAVDYGTTAPIMAAATQRLDAIVSEFNNLRPGVATILSSIVYRNDNSGAYSLNGLDPYYNPAMQGIAFNHVLAGQNVSFLDLRNLMNFATDISSDGIHPTQAGYDKMANAWYQSVAYGQAYFTGSQGTVWNTVNGSVTNFAMDAALTTDRGRGLNDATTNTFLIYPDVYFNNNTAALNTTLGADTTVRSLNFTAGATGAVSIGAGNTLTIGAVDSSVTNGNTYTLQNTGGITMQAGTGAHTIAANVVLGADQTWGNVSSNHLTVTGGVGGAHSLAFVGSTTVYQPGTYTPNGTSYQYATLTTTSQTTNGAGGGFVLKGDASYTGATTISNVTVTLDNAGTTTARLSGTTGITLNPGGTLLLASSGGASVDRVNNAATLTLAGGTLNTGGLSEGTAAGGVPTAGLGAVTLTANSVLDLGAGTSVVTFARSSAAAWTGGVTLKVYDWTGNTAGGGADAVYFGNDATGLTGAQLAQVAFYSDAGTTFLGNGSILANGEIVPVPVPEPATVAGGLILTVIAAVHARRLRNPR